MESRLTEKIDKQAAEFDTKQYKKLVNQEEKFESSLEQLETRVQGNIRDALNRLRSEIHNDRLQMNKGIARAKNKGFNFSIPLGVVHTIGFFLCC